MNYELNKNDGYVKLYRSIWDNPVVSKDADHIAVWVYLLTHATHDGTSVMFGGKRIRLKPGELTTGRKVLAREMQISESKVQRILKSFESEQQIEQRTDRQCRLISILNWNEYQQSEQRNEQRVNNDRTTSEQRVNTKQECKNERMKEERGETPPALADIRSAVQEENLNVDPEIFWNYYEEHDWRDKNGRLIKDWRKTLHTWSAREEKDFRKKPEPVPKPKPYEPPKVEKPIPMPDNMRQKWRLDQRIDSALKEV